MGTDGNLRTIPSAIINYQLMILPTKFRRQLRHEADLWVQAGLIDRTTHDRIATRYQFAALDVESRNSLVTLLIGLGSVLIGLGVLTLVAANWQQLAREWRVIILISGFIAVNLVGFSYWREPVGSKQRFGQGLLLLGAMMLGGNMALMGQMFHVPGELFQLLIAWAVGVLLMAYSLRLTSLGILAQILMGIGYWQAYGSGLWSSNAVSIDPDWTYFLVQHMSILAICLFLPLAYWCRSQAIFTITGIAFITALTNNLQSSDSVGKQTLPIINILICFCISPLLLWGYGNLSQWWQTEHRDRTGVFGKISRRLAVLVLGLSCFGFSFIESSNVNTQSPIPANWDVWSVPGDLGIVSIVTAAIWLYLIRQALTNPRHYPWNRMTTAIAMITGAMAIALIFMTIDPAVGYMYGGKIFWLLLFAVAIGSIRSGLANSDRGAFWFGLGLLASRIIIWFLMTQNDLITKSLLFIVGGVGTIAVGLWFEGYVRRLSETKID